MALIVPGFRFIDLGLDGGPYDELAHPKVCWHMTEGGGLPGAESAFKPYPPHLGYDPRDRTRHQYIDLLRHSYALRGDESDDEYVIQIEVVGFSAQAPTWPAEWYRNIGMDVVRPLRELLRVPDAHLRFYGPGEGIVLASARSPIRLSDAAFRTFSGHLGHQHVPAPDEHWDPGGFRLDEAISASYTGVVKPTAPPPPKPEMEDEMIITNRKAPDSRAGILSGGVLIDITKDSRARDMAQHAIAIGTQAEITVTDEVWDSIPKAGQTA